MVEEMSEQKRWPRLWNRWHIDDAADPNQYTESANPSVFSNIHLISLLERLFSLNSNARRVISGVHPEGSTESRVEQRILLLQGHGARKL